MHNSEDKFKKLLLVTFKNGYIKKIPDYKQTMNSSLRGLPDFLVINNYETFWFEVKMTNSNKTFNLNDVRDTQWIEFKKMLDAGAFIVLAIYFGKDLRFINFKELYDLKFKHNVNSIIKDNLRCEVY